MNIFLWVLQGLLALHTVVGAVWKFSNTTEAVPTLKAIPHGGWMALIAFELVCAAGLVLPLVSKRLAIAAPLAAIGIAAEMMLFTAVHVASGNGGGGQVIYWAVVAMVCVFIAYGRFALQPL